MKSLMQHSGVRRVALLVTVCVAAAAATAVALAATGARSKHFAVLRSTRAHIATVAKLGTAQTALLSSTSAGKIKVVQQADGDICIVDETPTLKAGGCGHKEPVEELGLAISVPSSAAQGSGPEIITLVPDGVTAVTFQSSSGDTTVTPSGNFARFSGPGLSAAQYTLPDGTVRTIPASPHTSR